MSVIRRYTGVYAFLILLCLLAGGCDTVLQYPDEKDKTSVQSVRAMIELHTDFNPITENVLMKSGESEIPDVRYIIEIYTRQRGEARLYERIVRTVSDIQPGSNILSADVLLMQEEYDIYAWIDYVPAGQTEDFRYITESLKKISIADTGADGHNSRDAFCGKTSVDLRNNKTSGLQELPILIEMERPFGKFIIIATDMEKYQMYGSRVAIDDITPSETICTYEGYFPTAYNPDTRMAHAEEFKTGVRHKSAVAQYDSNTTVLTHNYVFICNDNTNVTVNLEIRNAAGVPLSYVKRINIPIQRNKLTVVRGDFLTNGMNYDVTGIYDSFEDEIIITVP